MTDHDSTRAAQRMLLTKLRNHITTKRNAAVDVHNMTPVEMVVARAYTRARASVLADVVDAIDETIGELK